MVVILSIFPPEDEIVDDVDDILDFFKPKEETPLEATSPFPIDKPLPKSEIGGTKSVLDVFKNKEKQPSALVAASPSIETPLPKNGTIGRRRPSLKDVLCKKENQPLASVAKLLPKSGIVGSRPALDVVCPKEKQTLASVATPPSIQTMLPKNGRFLRKPASEIVDPKEKQCLASVATPPSIKTMLPKNGRFVRKPASEVVDPMEKQRLASVATPPSIKTMLPKNGRFIKKTVSEVVDPKEKQRLASVATPPSIQTMLSKNGRFVRKPVSEVIYSKEKQPMNLVAKPPSIWTPMSKKKSITRKPAEDVFYSKEALALVVTPPSIKTPLPKCETVGTKQDLNGLGYYPKEKQTLALVTTPASYHIQTTLPKRRILERKPAVAILSPKLKQPSALLVSTSTPPLIEKSKPASIMKLDLLAQVMNESGLESSKDDEADVEKPTNLNKSKDSNTIVITSYHQNYLNHSKENQYLVATPTLAETQAPKNIIVQRKSGKFEKFEKSNDQITVVYNPKQTELTRHNIKINPIVPSKGQRFNCEKCPGIEFTKNDELIQHIISNHCKKITSSSETSVQSLKRKSDGSIIIKGFRAVGSPENPGVPVLFGGHNLPPSVEIGLTDLPKSGGAMAPLAPPGATGLNGEKIMVQGVHMQTPKSSARTPEQTNIQESQKRERRRNSRYNSAEFESYQTSDEKELENSKSSDTKRRRSAFKFEQ